MKRLLFCLLLVGVVGCGEKEEPLRPPSNNALEIMTEDLNAPLPPEPEVHFEGQGSVSGLVVLEGEAPAPSVFTLKEDMQELTGKETITRQPWQVSENGGLADCVVTLRNTDRKNAVQPEPLAGAKMVKNGTNFIPRILVVTKGTTLDYRNENSPCNCFEVRGRGLSRSRSIRIPAGQRTDLELETVDVCRVFSNLRPYYDAWIHVVDTPYYIITAQDGRFEFPDVAAGEYRLQVWHSGVKTLKREITVLDGKKQNVNFQFTLAKAGEVPVDSDLRYVVEDGTVRIIENSSRLGGLSAGTRLPERIDGKPVTSIGPKAYAGSSGRVFIIPDSVTDIGEQAFANCYVLEEVTIGKNVTSIGKGAFRFSMPLKSITIPGSVVSIGEEAFLGCRTLADITLNEGVSSIGKEAFVNTYVKEITIPKSIKSVGKDAFYSCTRLTTVTFLGDAPEEVGRVFSGGAIIYRKADAMGWGDTWGGRPVKLISEKP